MFMWSFGPLKVDEPGWKLAWGTGRPGASKQASEPKASPRFNHPGTAANPKPLSCPYLEPESISANAPKPLNTAQEAIELCTFGVEVFMCKAT